MNGRITLGFVLTALLLFPGLSRSQAEVGAEFNYLQNPNWVFFSACTAGDLATLTAQVDSNPELVRARLADGKIGLHLAAMTGKREAVEFLLNRGSDINARDVYDKTPRFYADTACFKALAADLRTRGGVITPSQIVYGDGQHTLFRNCYYLGCPSCYWASVGGRPEPNAPAGETGGQPGVRPLPPVSPPPPVQTESETPAPAAGGTPASPAK